MSGERWVVRDSEVERHGTEVEAKDATIRYPRSSPTALRAHDRLIDLRQLFAAHYDNETRISRMNRDQRRWHEPVLPLGIKTSSRKSAGGTRLSRRGGSH